MTAVDALGYLAASLVLATFCAKSMVTLRLLAIASNAAFITYALATGLYPIVVLHTVMLPLNLLRLRQVLRSSVRLSPDAAARISYRSRRRRDRGTDAGRTGRQRRRDRAGERCSRSHAPHVSRGGDPAQRPDRRLGVVPRRRVVGRGVNTLRPVALRGVDHNRESESL